MNDDIRRPRDPNNPEDQNKQPAIEPNEAPIPMEAPHLYGQEEGFAATSNPARKFRRNPFTAFKKLSKKQKIIVIVVAAVLIVGGGAGIYALTKSGSEDVTTPSAQKSAEAPASTTEASRLTGEQISPELNRRPLTGVMIENSPDARPQSGLKDAGVVYEAIAEGGITRFLALYQETDPGYIGPVRSVRPYYVDLLLPYDASLVHAGGSADGLAKVKALGVKDIDHGANSGAFQRAKDRYAPHNLYTSIESLNKVSTDRGYTSSNPKSLPRSAAQTGQTGPARSIDIAISSALYNVHYDYDQPSNTYKRTLGGKPHTDQRSGQQLTPKVVVVLAMNFSQNGIYSVYQTTGSGAAYIFQDGIVKQGTWSKASEGEQFTFTDTAGSPMTLNAGQTWISLVKAHNVVTFAP